ncbi:hypothetical protein ABZ499_03330 [Streptomyces sp. NPDC019990]
MTENRDRPRAPADEQFPTTETGTTGGGIRTAPPIPSQGEPT